MDIVTKALIEMRAHQDVAKEHGITAARVSLLVHMVKKKRLVIEELLDKQMTKRQNQKLIGKIIDQLVEDDAFIESVDDVVHAVKELTSQDFKPHVIKDVMKQMGMKWRKVTQIPLAGNRDRSKVLRQRWAQRFIKTPADTIVYSIDETWIPKSDQRTHRWCPGGSTNTVAALSMAPQVSMIVAAGSDGSIYLSLT